MEMKRRGEIKRRSKVPKIFVFCITNPIQLHVYHVTNIMTNDATEKLCGKLSGSIFFDNLIIFHRCLVWSVFLFLITVCKVL